MKKNPPNPSNEIDGPELAISLEKVCWVIVKAREFDVKERVTDPGSGSNASDDNMISVLESSADDPVEEEMKGYISSLSEDDQIDLVSLAWLGRGDATLEDWSSLRAEAARAHRDTANHTANYLLGEPLLSDFLEEGLAAFGLSCDSIEVDRL